MVRVPYFVMILEGASRQGDNKTYFGCFTFEPLIDLFVTRFVVRAWYDYDACVPF